jgi:mono/diheme cytochrome c family protein
VLVLVSCFAAAIGGCTKPSGAPDGGAPAASSAPSSPSVPVVKWEAGARDAAIAEGRTVIEKHQCTRCHAVDDVPTAARPLNCASCHVFLTGLKKEDKQRQQLVEKYGEEIIARYQRNIQHLIQLPALTGIAKRVKPAFLASFLRAPMDLRPTLEESMIRHKLTEDEIRKIVRYLAARAETDDVFAPGYVAPPDPPRPAAERIEEGKKLFLGRGCVACHTYGNLATGVTAEALQKAGVAAQLAPNLRFARERLRPDAIVAWIVNPQSLSPGTLMPALGLSIPEAEAVRDFLLFGDPALAPAPATPAPMMPKLLDRPVPYAEMKDKVLGRICVHCHMNDYEKDPGPGNRGGLGYAGIRLQMRTYEALVSGAIDEKGARYSVLAPRTKDGVAPIVDAMLRRRVEEPRDRVAAFHDHERPAYPDGLVGMPLGLPSMSDEEIAILATWIAQGCKGPTEITGKPGVDDGYLVPDGPIAKNQGCELRTPEVKRPAWAVDPRPAASAGK